MTEAKVTSPALSLWAFSSLTLSLLICKMDSVAPVSLFQGCGEVLLK